MAFGYPVLLELAGRRVVVIGAAAVREAKVRGLLAAGADDVLVVGPDLPDDAVRGHAGDPRVRIAARRWRPSDLNGAFLCIGSSPNAEERSLIARAARDRGVLVNVLDDVPNCDFAAPAIVRRGDLVIAIATGGRSPAVARQLREALGERFGPEWERILEVVGRLRDETTPLLPDLADRSRRWREALDLDEAERLVRAGRDLELRSRLRARLVGDGAA
jgi:precorrin-2 dehydrogenase / sirohydrochlorin ferrochelatase